VVSVTDADKIEVAYYEYDAWGNTMTEAGSWTSPYRFSTKEWDDDSGLYYFGARYYSPEIGRWTQRDPAGTVDGLNLYVYVSNEPGGRVDPWGMEWRKFWSREQTVGISFGPNDPKWLTERVACLFQADDERLEIFNIRCVLRGLTGPYIKLPLGIKIGAGPEHYIVPEGVETYLEDDATGTKHRKCLTVSLRKGCSFGVSFQVLHVPISVQPSIKNRVSTVKVTGCTKFVCKTK
jgi:RHS repeat-associated protein